MLRWHRMEYHSSSELLSGTCGVRLALLHTGHKRDRIRKVTIMTYTDLAELTFQCVYVEGRWISSVHRLLRLRQSFIQYQTLRARALVFFTMLRDDWKDNDMLEPTRVFV